jgi:NitT/TauT family transport system substrate-binding protein
MEGKKMKAAMREEERVERSFPDVLLRLVGVGSSIRKHISRCSAWLVLIAFVGFFGMGSLASPAFGADKIRLNLDWVVYGKHAGFFAGLDKGIYKKNGLDITIERGFGSGDTVKKVAAKTTDYGFADFGAVIIARSKGSKAKMLAVIHAKSLMAIMSLKGSGVRTPKDLEGKKVGHRAGGGVSNLLPALFAANKVDASKVQMINMAPTALIPSLVAGKVAVSADSYQTEFPTLAKAAAKSGKEAQSFLFSDFGVDLLSNGLIAHEDVIKGNKDRTRRWVTATMESFAWSIKNTDEAMKIFQKYAAAIDPKLARAHWEIAVKHLLVPEAKTHGIGYMLPERVTYAIDTLTKLLKLPRKVSNQEVADMSLLPKIVVN